MVFFLVTLFYHYFSDCSYLLIEKESKNIVMDANRYKVNEVTYMANNSTDKNEIIDYMNQTISASNSGQSNNNGNKPTQNGGSNNISSKHFSIGKNLTHYIIFQLKSK